MTDEILKPATEWELAGMVATLIERQIPVEVIGAGTKRGAGRPVATQYTLSTGALRGITLYEPTELVMSARAGTPLNQIEIELASRGQMLAFEPIDLGPALGAEAGGATIGGVFATNLSGPRRVASGAARDHLLGVRGINGRGEGWKAGGRVMKNVTGYDVGRGVTGSWGTLSVLTEVTFKVLPMPDDVLTLAYSGLTDDLAVELMSTALGLPFEVSGTAHLSPALCGRLSLGELKGEKQPVTLIRIENFSKSIGYRKERLKGLLTAYGKPRELDLEPSLKLWNELRRLAVFPNGPTQLWRISTSPKAAPKVVGDIKRHVAAEVLYDWSGGLVWMEMPATADAGTADVRRAVATHGGHATLIRAEDAVRRSVEVFQPLSPAIERLTRGMKAAFDPLGLFNPGRMYATM